MEEIRQVANSTTRCDLSSKDNEFTSQWQKEHVHLTYHVDAISRIRHEEVHHWAELQEC